MKSIFISVIIPAYKEAERIGVTLCSLDAYFSDKEYTYEIIVVSDGSPDNLVAVVNYYAQKIKNLRVIDNKINNGKGYVVRCGMNEAKGEYCLFMDADNSVNISNLDRFMLEIRKGSEVVIGSILIGDNVKEEHNGLHRRLLSRISKAPVRIFATPGIYDTQRGFKLFTRKAVQIIFPQQTINRFAFDIELLVIAMANNLPIKEVSVAFNNPPGSTVRLGAYLNSLGDLFRIVIRKMTGVYKISPVNSFQPSIAGRSMWVTGASAGLFFLLILGGFLLKTEINISVRADTPPALAAQAQAITVPHSAAEFHSSTVASAPSWLYQRKQMTKIETAQLLLVALFLVLFGADLVSGLVLPRVYKVINKEFFTPQGGELSYQPKRKRVLRKKSSEKIEHPLAI